VYLASRHVSGNFAEANSSMKYAVVCEVRATAVLGMGARGQATNINMPFSSSVVPLGQLVRGEACIEWLLHTSVLWRGRLLVVWQPYEVTGTPDSSISALSITLGRRIRLNIFRHGLRRGVAGLETSARPCTWKGRFNQICDWKGFAEKPCRR
jgi:hypothetical protein